MAKVLNPLNSTEARGRVGGLVYNTWRGIRTVKTHTDPGHQSDPKRQAHKLIVQAAGQRWRTITPAQRAAWEHYAATHTDIDWTGTPKRIAGYHWYVRIQTTLKDLELGYIDDPPTDTCLRELSTFITAYHWQNTWTVAWGVTSDLPLIHYVQIFMAGPHSPGRRMTLHNATYQGFDAYLNEQITLATPTPGFYTAFARPVRANGVRGSWTSLTDYHPPW